MNAVPTPAPSANDLDARSLDDRSRDVFRRIVEGYLSSGEAVGSRTISRAIEPQLSAATIRNVMSDLEHLGLVYAPHVSAGRMPTQMGLRWFVDGLMQVGNLSDDERRAIEGQLRGGQSVSGDTSVDTLLTEASQLLSGMARGAGLVIAGKGDERLRHIEFIRLEATRALVVTVGQSGQVENRIIELPAGMTASTLQEAANYLNAHAAGRTLAEARAVVAERLREARGEIDELAQSLVDQGLAVWGGEGSGRNGGRSPAQLIVRGRSNLLGDARDEENIERLRMLFDDLETKDGIIRLLDLAESGDGVRIFIGSENKLFSLSGSSLVVAPYLDNERRVVGAVGVIGPTRLNYARVVPVVDYTARLFSRLGEG